MKAKVILQDRDTEAAENAELLGMSAPESKDFEADVHFKLNFVHAAYINPDGDIICFLPSGSWLLNYNDELWHKIKAYLNIEE